MYEKYHYHVKSSQRIFAEGGVRSFYETADTMKTIILLSSILCVHTALAMTGSVCGRINTIPCVAGTSHASTVALIYKTHTRSCRILNVLSERADCVGYSEHQWLWCDLFGTEKSEDWYPDNPVGIIERTVTTVPSDVIGITTYPVDNFNETKIFAGITAALLITDRKTTWFLQNNVETELEFNYPRLFNSALIGGTDSYLVASLGALYAGSLAFGSEKGQTAALLSYKSIAYSVLFTHIVLKTLTARKRPFDPLEGPEATEEPYTRNQYDFFNFHRPYLEANINATSFPSFHFTLWFASARVLHRVYDNAVVPYSLCALGLLPGFGSHNHWFSDMVAGAMVGIAIGNVVTDNFFQKNSSKASVAPQKKHCYSVSLIPERSRCSLCLKYHF